MGGSNNLWEGADLHSDTTLPTNIQHVLAPADDSNDSTTINDQPTDQPIEENDPNDAEVDELAEYDETFADTPTASIQQDNTRAKDQAGAPPCRTHLVRGMRCTQTHYLEQSTPRTQL